MDANTFRWVAVWAELAANPLVSQDTAHRPWWEWTYVPGEHRDAIGDDRPAPVPRDLTIGITVVAIIIGLGVGTLALQWLLGHPVAESGRALFWTISVGFAGFAATIAGGLTRQGLEVVNDRYQLRRDMRADAARATAITIDTFRTGPAMPGQPAAGISIEGQLVAVATVTARGVQASRAWHSTHLDLHRVRLDLAEEARQLADRAARLHRARRELGPRPQPDSPGLAHVAALWDQQTRTADRIQGVLAERVEALIRYRQHLDLLSRELTALDMVAGGSVSEQLADLLAGSVADRQATEHLRELTAEARARITAVHDVLGMLSHDVRVLRAEPTP